MIAIQSMYLRGFERGRPRAIPASDPTTPATFAPAAPGSTAPVAAPFPFPAPAAAAAAAA